MTSLLKRQSHIVVIDSRPFDYQNLPRLAGEYGWHVHFLTSARAAIRFVKSLGVDLWIIGVNLPDMSGFELLETLREQLSSARVFIVSDRYDPEHEIRACGVGAAFYVSKTATGLLDCTALLEVLADPHAIAAEHVRAPPASVL